MAKRHRLRLRHLTRGLNIPSGLLKSFRPPLSPDHESYLQALVDGRNAAGPNRGHRAAPLHRRGTTGQRAKLKLRRAGKGGLTVGNYREEWPDGGPRERAVPPDCP